MILEPPKINSSNILFFFKEIICFLSHWICYNTASVFCFGFFGPEACGVLAPWSGMNPYIGSAESLPLDRQGSPSNILKDTHHKVFGRLHGKKSMTLKNGYNCYDQPRQHIKKQRRYLTSKGPSSQSYGFSSGHVWMWELDCEESWVPKNWCFWSVLLEKTLVRPLDCKEIQQVHSEGDQPWDFFGRNDAKAETPVLWPPDAKSWLTGKDSDAGRDWGQEE